MSNILYPGGKGMEIRYRRRITSEGEKMHFSLFRDKNQLAKAVITADQLEKYILENNTISNVPEDIKKFYYLLKNVEDLLQSMPDENSCSDKEKAVYTDLYNLKQSLVKFLSLY